MRWPGKVTNHPQSGLMNNGVDYSVNWQGPTIVTEGKVKYQR